MPFGLKNAPSEFQNIMNDIFNPFSSHAIVYIDDVLIFQNPWTNIGNTFEHFSKQSGSMVLLFQLLKSNFSRLVLGS